MGDVTKPVERYLRLLGKPVSNLSAETHSLRPRGPGDRVAESPVALSQANVSEKLSLLKERLDTEASQRPDDFKKLSVTSRAIVRNAAEGMQKLRLDGPDAKLTQTELIAIEAIVETDGSRPSLRFVEDELIVDKGVKLGHWSDVIHRHRAHIEASARSIGRIDLNGDHYGTGFSIGGGMIITNRHVLQMVANSDDSGKWRFRGAVTIDFGSGESRSADRCFLFLEEGIVTSDREIDLVSIDFAKFDYAVLRCAVADRAHFPPALIPETDAGHIIISRPVYAIGFPGKPTVGAYPFAVLADLFGYTFGIKRFSPGEIESVPGAEPGDTRETVMRYDATTLPGSSGSAVIDVDVNGASVPGLHFAGWSGGNYAHALATSPLRDDMEDRGIHLPVATRF